MDPAPDARVLDVATGPGDVVLGFAARCRAVIGIDLTAGPLAIAEEKRGACRGTGPRAGRDGAGLPARWHGRD